MKKIILLAVVVITGCAEEPPKLTFGEALASTPYLAARVAAYNETHQYSEPSLLPYLMLQNVPSPTFYPMQLQQPAYQPNLLQPPRQPITCVPNWGAAGIVHCY